MDLITDHRIYSLSELLQRDKYEYRIPLYQRDYQWTDAQIDDFEDELFHTLNEIHFDDSPFIFGFDKNEKKYKIYNYDQE